MASDAGIPISLLIDNIKGNSSNFEQGIWIHPYLAIQLAQWINPLFALKVSYWIRTLLLKGQVELNIKLNTKSIKEKDQEIKQKDL